MREYDGLLALYVALSTTGSTCWARAKAGSPGRVHVKMLLRKLSIESCFQFYLPKYRSNKVLHSARLSSCQRASRSVGSFRTAIWEVGIPSLPLLPPETGGPATNDPTCQKESIKSHRMHRKAHCPHCARYRDRQNLRSLSDDNRGVDKHPEAAAIKASTEILSLSDTIPRDTRRRARRERCSERWLQTEHK